MLGVKTEVKLSKPQKVYILEMCSRLAIDYFQSESITISCRTSPCLFVFLKASIVGELMFLDENSLLEKMPLVKADEKDDAGPLPVKVHIDATTL